MNQAKIYGVYTARFPYIDKGSEKIRPVIVVSEPYGQYHVVAIVPVSSKSDRETVDLSLSCWESEGLIKQSIARTHRLTTMLQSDLNAELGILDSKDMKNLQSSLRKFLNL